MTLTEKIALGLLVWGIIGCVVGLFLGQVFKLGHSDDEDR